MKLNRSGRNGVFFMIREEKYGIVEIIEFRGEIIYIYC